MNIAGSSMLYLFAYVNGRIRTEPLKGQPLLFLACLYRAIKSPPF